ncbi:MAG: acyl-CoA dehydrogenase family protein [Pseudoclavibacter sp.]
MMSRPSPVPVPPHEGLWVAAAAAIADASRATVAGDDAEARLPVEHLRALHASGLDNAVLPESFGGNGLSYAALGRIVETLSEAHPALATVWLMHVGAAHAAVTLTVPEVGEYFAAELRAGRRFANALSEPAGGNLFLRSQQDVVPTAMGWSFTGRKLFVSGSELADHLFLGARRDGAPAFFGVTVDGTVAMPAIDETAGMRATRSRTLVFDGTPIARERRCRAPEASETSLITAAFPFLSLGIATSAIGAIREAAGRRSSASGESLADASWVRADVGAMWVRIEAARLLAERSLWLADQGSPATRAATEAKLLANVVAVDAAALAVKVCGGGGYLLRSPVQRIFRDAQAGALMAYSVPFASELVGERVLATGE